MDKAITKNIEQLAISSTAMYYESMLNQASPAGGQRFYETAVSKEAKAWPVLLDLSSQQVLYVGSGLLLLLGLTFSEALTNGGSSLINLPKNIAKCKGTTCQVNGDRQTVNLIWKEVLTHGKIKYYEVEQEQ
jgi:hypothetical protein